MIGLYPMTSTTTFLIGSPWFSDLTIDIGNSKKVVIKSTGGSDIAYYVQKLKLNGKLWNKNWLTWDDLFANGGTLEFVLGSKKTLWDTGPPPPSFATTTDE